MRRFEILAPAKINLTLHVLGKRPDGFHDLSTLMVPIDLADRLELTVGGAEVRVRVPGRPELEGEGNLCAKAARAFSRRFGVEAGVEVVLHKEVPVAAGLGGGSSDAAAVLRVLAHLHGVDLSDPRLVEAALAVGSDVPFFLRCVPALARGRGERLEAAPALPTLHLLIVKPPFGVSAGEAYGALARLRAEAALPPGEERPLPDSIPDAAAAVRLLHNDLEAAVASVHPVAPVRARLEAAGGLGSLMSGSGSCLFTVARDAADASNCSKSFHKEAGERLFVAETLQAPPRLWET